MVLALVQLVDDVADLLWSGVVVYLFPHGFAVLFLFNQPFVFEVRDQGVEAKSIGFS